MNPLALILVAVVALVATAPSIAGATPTAPETACHDEPSQLRRLRGAAFETAFMNHLIAHHGSALAMSELALERSATPEVVELAEDIIAKQAAEIALLTGWLSAWYGQPARPVMDPCTMRQEEEDMMHLASLSGLAFDEFFLELMVRHHAMAIRMATTAPGRAVHRALVRLSLQVIFDQTREIAYIRSLLRDLHRHRCHG